MTTQRIEEIKKEVASEWKCTCKDCGHINDDYDMDDLLELVTEAHQAGIDEMAEHIIGILKQSYLMTNGYKDTDTFRTAMYIENENFNIAINKRLDFFIEQIEKALQDTKQEI